VCTWINSLSFYLLHIFKLNALYFNLIICPLPLVISRTGMELQWLRSNTYPSENGIGNTLGVFCGYHFRFGGNVGEIWLQQWKQPQNTTSW